jgi:hypothetical protein
MVVLSISTTNDIPKATSSAIAYVEEASFRAEKLLDNISYYDVLFQNSGHLFKPRSI